MLPRVPIKRSCRAANDAERPLQRRELLSRVCDLASHSALLSAAGILVPASRSLSATQIDPDQSRSDQSHLITPAAKRAIDQGLSYLAGRQHDNGSFGTGSYKGNVAVSGLCGMAFLSSGHMAGRGKYGQHVENAIQYVLSRSQPSGLIKDEKSASHGPMYGHGFATLFLAESYGMTRSKELRKKLVDAVKLIINTQNKEGGWRYTPDSNEADISVTVCQIMALRAARNSGIYVPKDIVQRCTEYVKRCQNSDGGFRYQLVSNSRSEFARSAAGVVAIYSAGIYEGREIQSGIKFLNRWIPRNSVLRFERNYFYGHYYAAQAMWHAGEPHWGRWYPAIRDELLQLRRPLSNGTVWRDASYSNEYATAMACLILQLPASHLPIFER